MTLQNFRHIAPALRIHYGEDCLTQLPAELKRVGSRRAVVFCGKSVARAPNGLATVRAALGGLCAGVFDAVQAQSPLPSVVAGVEALQRYDADAIIAVGGGSAVVTARAAAIVHAEGRSVGELCTRFEPGRPPVSPRLAADKLPQLIVPTTPSTAYAKAGTAVLDPEQHRRLTMFDPKTRAQAIFFHPALTASAPAALVQDAALNAFVMAIQGLESATREPLADALLLQAVRLSRDHLPLLATAPNDPDMRGHLMLAALLAGQGTDYTSGGLASVLAHCIGARFGLPNGVTNAVLLPHTIRFNEPATGDRLAAATDMLGGGDSATAVAQFLASLGLPTQLRALGISEDSLPQIVTDASTDWFLYQNPRRITDPNELLPLLREAY